MLHTRHLTPIKWHMTPDKGCSSCWCLFLHVTFDRWHLTPDSCHMTGEMWTWHLTHLTSDTWHLTIGRVIGSGCCHYNFWVYLVTCIIKAFINHNSDSDKDHLNRVQTLRTVMKTPFTFFHYNDDFFLLKKLSSLFWDTYNSNKDSFDSNLSTGASSDS